MSDPTQPDYRAYRIFLAIMVGALAPGYLLVNFLSVRISLSDHALFTAALWALAIFAAIFFLMCRAGVAQSQGAPFKLPLNLKYWAYFAGLLIASTYGIFTALMLVYDGPQIIKEQSDTSLQQMAALRARAEIGLPVRSFTEVEARVNGLRSRLYQEIVVADGHNNCGVGPSALETIGLIAQDLKGFAYISGTNGNHNCQQRKVMQGYYDQYASMIDKMLAGHPYASANNKAARDTLRTDIDAAVTRHEKRLRDLQASLAGVGKFTNTNVYSDSVRRLRAVAADYTSLRERLISFDPEAAELLKARIDLTDAESLGSGLLTFRLLFVRADKWWVWAFLLVPLGIDVALSRLMARVVAAYRRNHALLATLAADPVIPDTDVTYLWTRPANRTAD